VVKTQVLIELIKERSALRDLQERDDIIIKPADKGSAVVVMDKNDIYTRSRKTTLRLSIFLHAAIPSSWGMFA
jgi:hypothetical protein